MKAVILAAGKSTRTYPLTVDTPKVLLPAAGKPLIRHTLEALEGIVDEAVIVVGFRKDRVIKYLGERFGQIKISYAEQKEQLGTAHALLAAEPFLEGDFIVLAGDDIYSMENIGAVSREGPSVLAMEVDDPSRFGIWLEKRGMVAGFQEKPREPASRLANCSLYRLGPDIFPHIRRLSKTVRGEFELNEAINSLAREVPVRIVRAVSGWVPVGYPWSLLEANQFLLDRMEPANHAWVSPGAFVTGRVSLGEGTRILPGSVIEGPAFIGANCTIGPGAYIRPYTSVGDNCRLRAEVVDSVIMDNTTAKHFSYIGHSVIGRNVNIAAGTVTADFRHDGGEHHSLVRGERVATGRRKLGAFIGDNVRTGINTSIYPGRKIWPGMTTLPGEVVSKDIIPTNLSRPEDNIKHGRYPGHTA
jgi:bifunctional UDP-N-acetylglucosamine pyrophosphorylase/glucosamine-1-phosphate N-acetyltransferase